jgi:hypothetical protein
MKRARLSLSSPVEVVSSENCVACARATDLLMEKDSKGMLQARGLSIRATLRLGLPATSPVGDV